MSLINLRKVQFSVGGPPLLDHVDLAVEAGDRIAVIGRNGEGKSTLLRLIEGQIVPEEGELVVAAGIRVASLPQEVPPGLAGPVTDVVAGGLGEVGSWLAAYHEALEAGADPTEDRLLTLHERIEDAGGWDLERTVAATVSRLDLPGEKEFRELSGGLQRRVLLGRALVTAPDVLLLDEPTNHLDIEAIEALEGSLRDYQGALIFVTHDRRFLKALANRIVELDRGQLTSWPGDYANYLRRREERLHAEAIANDEFDKRLAEEEVWIRQGIKARRTRNEGRVRALKAMRRERADRRVAPGEVRLNVNEAGRSGRKVVVAEHVDLELGGRTILADVSTTILRGDRVGLIGPNGSGKTTLLRALLGELAPSAGTVTLGTGIEVAYFDQHREALREDWNAVENVAEGREFVTVQGRQRHAIGYLQDFLFTPDRARAPISRLSGGERNRLLLARLFARPSNLLVLDEPTNDLDIETLELLEEQLLAYPGTLILVSHDRDFLDGVVTSTLVIQPGGGVQEFVGGYSDWERQRRPASADAPAGPAAEATQPTRPTTAGKKPRSRRLGYLEQRELDALPARIEALETELAELSEQMGDPAFFQGDDAAVTAATSRLQALEAELAEAFERWEALEGQAG